MSETVLVALGGNALIRDEDARSFDDQLANAQTVAECLATAIDPETRLVVTHGNGPQVGNLLLQNDLSEERVNQLPLFGVNAASQGLIGALIGLAFNNEFSRQDLSRRAIPLLTSISAATDDPVKPTKPVGPFYDAAEADAQASSDAEFQEDAGRGWRRVVPSPDPERVALADQIRMLMEQGDVPVAAGGGGLPVLGGEDRFEYINGVVDKDLAAAQLAKQLEADRLVILTDVEHVMLNYGTDDEKLLHNVDCQSAREYLAAGHFERGSMYEKVDAVCRFLESGGDKRAAITSLDRAADALDGKGGTQFVPESGSQDNMNA